MASKTTGWSCTHEVSSVTYPTATTAQITVTVYWQNSGWTYDIGHVSAWVYCGSQSKQVLSAGNVDTTASTTTRQKLGSYTFTVNRTTATQTVSCYGKITSASSYVSGTKTSSATSKSVSAKTSYTVSYNANGGSNPPSAQTKWYGTTLKLSTVKPTRTGYSFQGWATSSGGSVAYASGANYTANAAATLYAVWKANTYTVTYNANGGSGAPGNQTKTYGVALTLSSTKPTRTNYNFLGWATSSTSTTVAYKSGASYTGNATLNLYAVWELAYTKPRITGFSISRCDVNGDFSDEGSYALIEFNWATDKTVTSIKIEWTSISSSSGEHTIAATGTSGSVSEIFGGGNLSSDSTYNMKLTVADSIDSSYVTGTLNGTKFVLDILAGGKGAAMGKPAEIEGALDMAWDIRMNDHYIYDYIERLHRYDALEEGDLDTILTTVFNGMYVYSTRSIHVAMDIIDGLPGTGGWLITIHRNTTKYGWARAYRYTNAGSMYVYERSFYNGVWSSWVDGRKSNVLAAGDTREDNEAPEWYISTYGSGVVCEFKKLASIGFTNPSVTYTGLLTIIPWKDTSGGMPRQLAFDGNRLYVRTSTSTTAWGSWKKYLCEGDSIDAETLDGYDSSALLNNCTSLWSGSMTTNTSATMTFDSKYSGIVVMGKPGGKAISTIYVPRWCLNTTATSYQIADETTYISFNLSHNGSGTLTLTRTASNGTTGSITRVMGVS